MEIIRRWLRDEIQLQMGPDFNLEREFANGFKFGKVLEFYGKMPDVDKLMNKERPEAKLVNYRRLQPHFKALDVKLDSGIANKLMTEEHGVALIILQQLKIALDIPKKAQKTTTSLALLRPPTSGGPPIVDGRPGTGTGLMGMSVKLEQHLKHKVMESQGTERRYWQRKQEPREYVMQAHTHKFEAAALQMQRDTDAYHLEMAEQRRQALLAKRDLHLQSLHENRAYLQEWEQQGKATQRLNQRTKTERQKRDLQVELARQEKLRRHKAMARDEAEAEVQGGILAFEENLRRTQDQAVGAEPTEEQVLNATSTQSPLAFLSSLSATLPPPSSLSKDAVVYMNKIAERKEEEHQARRERDRRRRRVLVEQAQTHKDMEDRRREQEVLSRVQSKTEEERVRAAELLETRERKLLDTLQRKERAEAFAAARQAEWDALMREREAEPADETLAMTLTQRRQQFSEEEAGRTRVRQEKHAAMCQEVVHGLVDFSVKAAFYREGNGKQLIPDSVWNHWLLNFYASEPLFPPPDPQTAPTPAPPLAEDEEAEEDPKEALANALVDRRQYVAYMDGEDWGAGGGGGLPLVQKGELEGERGTLGGNPWLGAVVEALRLRLLEKDAAGEVEAAPEKETKEEKAAETGAQGEGGGEEEEGGGGGGEGEGEGEEEEEAEEAPAVRAVCVTGAPLAGVKRQAHNLAAETGMELLILKDEVDKVVKEYEEAMAEWEEQKRQEEEERAAAAAEAEEEEPGEGEGEGEGEEGEGEAAAEEEAPTGPELTATAKLGEAFKAAGHPGTPPPDALLTELLQLKLKDLDGAGPGCVVLGAPASVNHFGLLQNAMTPLALPPPTPLPPASRLAPPPAAQELRPRDLAAVAADPRRGALTYLRLHCTRAVALQRVKGRMVDPEDEVGGQSFHEDNDPCPDDSPAAGRLEGAEEGAGAMKAVMGRHAKYWEEKLALDTYMSRLGGMVQEVEAGGPMEEVKEAVLKAVAARMKELDPPAEAEEGEGGEGEEEGEGEEGAEEEEAAAEEDAEEDADAEEEAPFGVEVPLAVPVETAREVYGLWEGVEGAFEAGMREQMRRLRGLEKAAVESVAGRLAEFIGRLREGDGKESLLQAFQTEFNALPEHVRQNPATQAELRERAEDVMHRLWELSDASREEAEAAREASMAGRELYGWLKAICKTLALMMQEEITRFRATERVVSRFSEIVPEEAEGDAGAETAKEEGEEGGDAGGGDEEEAAQEEVVKEEVEEVVEKEEEEAVDVVALMKKLRGRRVEWGGEGEGAREGRPERPDPAEERDGDDGVLREEDKELLQTLERAVEHAVDQVCGGSEPHGGEGGKEGRVLLREMAEEAVRDGGAGGVRVAGRRGEEVREQAVAQERVLLRARAESVVRRAAAVAKGLRGREAQLFERMDAVLGKRYKGEMQNIEGVMSEIGYAIDTATRLHLAAPIQVTDFADGEESQSYCIFAPPAPPPPREELLPSWRLSSSQLLRLTSMLKAAKPAGIVSVPRLAALLQRAAEVPGEQVLPRRWLLLAPSQLLAFLAIFDPLGRKRVDWRRFILLLAETLSPPPPLEALTKLKASVSSSPFPLAHLPKPSSNALPLWFDARPAPLPEAKPDGEMVLRGRPWRAVKEVVVEAFSRKAEGGEGSDGAGKEEVDMESLLLYACACSTAADGTEKASKVLGDQSGEMDDELLQRIVEKGCGPESSRDRAARTKAVEEALKEARGEPEEEEGEGEEGGEEEGEEEAEEEEEGEDGENGEEGGGKSKKKAEKPPPRKVKVSELVEGVKGAPLVGTCFAFEALDPYAILDKLVWEPAVAPDATAASAP